MPHSCKWFKPANLGEAGTRFAWADDFPPEGVSGVYAIASLTGVVLYVGESHTGRLRKTVARHFQVWNDQQAERPVYDRHQVQICWAQTAPADALETETQWMIDLEPRDNLDEPVDDDDAGEYDDSDEYEPANDDEVPF